MGIAHLAALELTYTERSVRWAEPVEVELRRERIESIFLTESASRLRSMLGISFNARYFRYPIIQSLRTNTNVERSRDVNSISTSRTRHTSRQC
jgi:hypothetical protein